MKCPAKSFCGVLLPAAKGPHPSTHIAAEKIRYAAIKPCPAILSKYSPTNMIAKRKNHPAVSPNFKEKQSLQLTEVFSPFSNIHRRPTHLRTRSAPVLLRKTPWQRHGLLFHKRVARLRIYTRKRAIHHPTILGGAHLRANSVHPYGHNSEKQKSFCCYTTYASEAPHHNVPCWLPLEGKLSAKLTDEV